LGVGVGKQKKNGARFEKPGPVSINNRGEGRAQRERGLNGAIKSGTQEKSKSKKKRGKKNGKKGRKDLPVTASGFGAKRFRKKEGKSPTSLGGNNDS